MLKQAMRWMMLPAAAAVLVACGGSGSVSQTPTNSLSGIVAVGAALPSASIVLRDALGNTRTATSDVDGRYQIDTTGLQAPFVIRAAGAIGSQEFNLVSLLPSQDPGQNQSVQITPLTTAIAGLVNAANGFDADSLAPAQITTTGVAAARQVLVSALASPIQAAGLDSSFDPISQNFAANRRGADQVLDVVDVRLRPDGVVLSNRMEVLGANSDPSNLIVTNAGVRTGTTWPSGVVPAGDALNDLERKIKECFALPASARAGAPIVDAGGVVSVAPTSIAQVCKNFVVDDYETNTYSFAERWGWFLSSSEFLNSNIILNLRYVQAVPTENPISGGNAYVVNINIQDINGNWYTRPEVLERTAANSQDTFKFFGNRRKMDFSIDSTISYIDDLANPLNSRVEGRLQFNSSPHRAKIGQNVRHQYFYEPNTSKAQPKVICAWVTGPMLQTGALHDIEAPKGGILLKIPHPDIVQTRAFMAVHAKYSEGFDPVLINAHKELLMSDCREAQLATDSRIATLGTNNQFTFSAAKATTAATWVYPGVNARNFPVTDANVTTCVTGNCPRRSYVNFRSTEVSAADQSTYMSLYGNTSMPRFTVYAFQSDGYENNESNPTSVWSNVNDFWASKNIAHIRMVGSMPFILKDTGGTYSDVIKFRKPNAESVNQYLADSTATLSSGDVLTMGWDVPAGAQGIDRFGGKAQAYFLNNQNQENIINASIFQFSRAAPRSARTGSITLTDQWLGTDAIGQNYSNSRLITSVQRELWARSYDTENRQIQYVYVRKTNQTTP